MLEATRRHLFSSDFVVRSPSGATVELDVAVWRERAEFDVDGARHRLYREGRMRGAFVLERAGFPLAKAIKPSAFKTRFEIEFQGRTYVLRKRSVFSRRFIVTLGEQEVGGIRPAGLFSRRTFVDLPPDWPLAVKLFVFWLVLIIWKREAAAAS